MASLFTKIISGEIKGTILYQDDHCAAIVDIQPQAPHHFLVVPKKEIPSVAHADAGDEKTLGHLLVIAAKIARDYGFAESGYRLVINTGANGGQTVDHLHVHVLGGRKMNWPPG